MLALSLDQAKTIAIVVASVLVLGSITATWVMKTVAQKVVTGVVLVGLALLVWTQRTSLQDCADDVRAQAGSSVTSIETTCRFLGSDVTISTRSGN